MLSILSGKRTYVTLAAGILATWATFLLGATCPAPDPAAVVEVTSSACGTFAGIKVTFADALAVTWAGIAGMFGRAAIPQK